MSRKPKPFRRYLVLVMDQDIDVIGGPYKSDKSLLKAASKHPDNKPTHFTAELRVPMPSETHDARPRLYVIEKGAR